MIFLCFGGQMALDKIENYYTENKNSQQSDPSKHIDKKTMGTARTSLNALCW